MPRLERQTTPAHDRADRLVVGELRALRVDEAGRDAPLLHAELDAGAAAHEHAVDPAAARLLHGAARAREAGPLEPARQDLRVGAAGGEVRVARDDDRAVGGPAAHAGDELLDLRRARRLVLLAAAGVAVRVVDVD